MQCMAGRILEQEAQTKDWGWFRKAVIPRVQRSASAVEVGRRRQAPFPDEVRWVLAITKPLLDPQLDPPPPRTELKGQVVHTCREHEGHPGPPLCRAVPRVKTRPPRAVHTKLGRRWQLPSPGVRRLAPFPITQLCRPQETGGASD